MNQKAVVVFSGGQDSTTVLFMALESGYDVHAITFDYGQRHAAEIVAADRVLRVARLFHPDRTITHEVCIVGAVLKGTSPLVSGEELEQYESHEALPGGLEKTFVPMRNQLFLTIAANRAYVMNCNTVFTGVAQEDFGGYPDCRQEFIDALMNASSLGTFTGEDGAPAGLMIVTPLMDLSKGHTVAQALGMPGCYEALAYSHTAYDGQYPPTGMDHATLLRQKGFEAACVPDPLVYRAIREGKMTRPDRDNYDITIPEVLGATERLRMFFEEVADAVFS